MTGNSPCMNLPEVKWAPSRICSIKIRWSPLIISPAAFFQEPNSNQNGAWKMWCKPNGINSRLINPNKNTAKPVLESNNPSLNAFKPFWIVGQIIAIGKAKIKDVVAIIIGTKRLPAKNPKYDGKVIL